MKVVAILQARMNSTRLPGKVLMEAGGIPMICRQIERTFKANVDDYWLATTDTRLDDPLVEEVTRLGISIFRGDESNVLSRFTEISRNVKADAVVRITGDNPLNHWTGIDELIHQFNPNAFDYISDFDSHLFPTGSFPEIVSATELFNAEKALGEKLTSHHAHVTSWTRVHARTSQIHGKEIWPRKPGWRWTVDYREDFDFVNQVFELLGDQWREFNYERLCALIENHPEISSINSHLAQKSEELG